MDAFQTQSKVIAHFRTIKKNQLNDIIACELIDFDEFLCSFHAYNGIGWVLHSHNIYSRVSIDGRNSYIRIVTLAAFESTFRFKSILLLQPIVVRFQKQLHKWNSNWGLLGSRTRSKSKHIQRCYVPNRLKLALKYLLYQSTLPRRKKKMPASDSMHFWTVSFELFTIKLQMHGTSEWKKRKWSFVSY